MSVSLLTSLSLAAATCPATVEHNVVFTNAMTEAEEAFSALDLEAFQLALDSAVFAVPCLTELVSPAEAAQFHRLQALRQFLANEENEALSSFQSARRADPAYEFPAELVPNGHAIRDLYAQAAALPEGQPAPTPQIGTVYVDGLAQGPLSPQGPNLVQVLGEDGVRSSTYRLPGDAPSYASVPATEVGRPRRSSLPMDGPQLSEARLSLHKPRFFTGVGLGALALGSWALASRAANTYQQPQPSWGEPELRRQERLTNGLTLGAGVASVASIGMMGSAVMVLRW